MNKKTDNIIKAIFNEDWKLFGILNALFAIPIGIYGYTFSFAATHFHFYLTAPILTFFILGYAWKVAFKKKGNFTISSLIAVVLISVPLIHFLAYLILIYFDLISENLAPTEYSSFYSIGSFVYFFIAAIPFALVSIYKLYFSTLIIPFVIGILINKKSFANN